MVYYFGDSKNIQFVIRRTSLKYKTCFKINKLEFVFLNLLERREVLFHFSFKHRTAVFITEPCQCFLF